MPSIYDLSKQRSMETLPQPDMGKKDASMPSTLIGGALGALIGAFAGNPAMGASIGSTAGGMLGSAMNGDRGAAAKGVVPFASQLAGMRMKKPAQDAADATGDTAAGE